MTARAFPRTFFLALFLLLEYSCLLPAAHAAKRPGAPRPLQLESGELVVGTSPQGNANSLGFTREQNDVVTTFYIVPVTQLGKTAYKFQRQYSHRSMPESLRNLFNVSSSPDLKKLASVSNRSGLEAIYVEPNTDFKSPSDSRRLVTLARNPAWLDASTLLYESTRPGREGIYKISIPPEGDVSPPYPQLVFSKPGEAAVSPDGKLICVAARDERLKDTQLYLLSADGSGARSIAQTIGARHPAFSSGGDAIYFDAPAPRDEKISAKNAAENSRVIWMLPILSTPPVAQLVEVRQSKIGELEVVGTALSQTSGALQTTLEIGAGDGENGDEPKNWRRVETRATPIDGGVLAAWIPAMAQNSAWTLRLNVVDDDGDRAGSTLSFTWPPKAALGEIIAPAIFATQPERFGLDTTKTAAPRIAIIDKTKTPAPKIENPKIENPKIPLPQNQTSDGNAAQPLMATANFPKAMANVSLPNGATPSTPVMAQFPATPRVEIAPPIAPIQTISKPAREEFFSKTALPLPAPPATVAPKISKSKSVRVAAKTVASKTVARKIATSEPPPVRAQTRPQPKPKPTPKPILKPTPAPMPAPKLAAKNASGIPSQMKAGASVAVTVNLKNTGSRAWSSTGDSPVRLIYRWVEIKSNIRQRWAVQWLSSTVAPGQSTRLKFTLAAPAHAGEYVLTYALVRLNSQIYDGQKYTPPPTKSADQRWPGEFGAVSFRIAVTP